MGTIIFDIISGLLLVTAVIGLIVRRKKLAERQAELEDAAASKLVDLTIGDDMDL